MDTIIFIQKEFGITTLSKKFIIIIFLLLSIFTFLFFINSNKNDNYSLKISAITKLPNISFSNDIFEPRIKEYEDDSTKFYFVPFEVSYLDFVYEK
jgi:hypothetical protein